MTIKYILLLSLILIGCKPKSNREGQSITKDDSIKLNMSIKTEIEDFILFFEKFRSDSLFQKGRIDNPLSVIFSEEDSEKEILQEVNYVSFDAKDWDMKINIRTEEISKDSVNVILDGNNTGVHLEHLFALRSEKWYLFQIKNLSD